MAPCASCSAKRAASLSRHKKMVSLEAAVAKIPNGAVVMPCGFMGVGSPQRLIDELVRRGAVTSRTSIRRVDLVVTELAMITPDGGGTRPRRNGTRHVGPGSSTTNPGGIDRRARACPLSQTKGKKL